MRYVGKGGVTQDRCPERRLGGQAAGNVQNLWVKVVALRGGHGRNQGRSIRISLHVFHGLSVPQDALFDKNVYSN